MRNHLKVSSEVVAARQLLPARQRLVGSHAGAMSVQRHLVKKWGLSRVSGCGAGVAAGALGTPAWSKWRLGWAIAGRHGLIRLQLKARGGPPHSVEATHHLRPHREAVALEPEAAHVAIFAAFDHAGAISLVWGAVYDLYGKTDHYARTNGLFGCLYGLAASLVSIVLLPVPRARSKVAVLAAARLATTGSSGLPLKARGRPRCQLICV